MRDNGAERAALEKEIERREIQAELKKRAQASTPEENNTGFLGKLGQSLDIMGSQAGGMLTPFVRGAQNTMKGMDAWRQLLQGKPYKDINVDDVYNLLPKGKTVSDLAKPNQSPAEKTASSVGEPLGEIAAMVGTGAGPASWLGRLGMAGATGALTSDNPALGGATGLAGGALGESVPGILKLGKMGAGYLKPTGLTQKLMQELSLGLQKAKAATKPLYDSVLNKVGLKNIYEGMPKAVTGKATVKDLESGMVPGSYKDFAHKYIKQNFPLGTDVKRAHDLFTEKPNFEHAHFLRKVLDNTKRKLEKAFSDPTSANKLEIVKQLRNGINNDMNRFLMHKAPDQAEKWAHANYLHATQTAPYHATKALHDVTSLNRPDLTPNQMIRHLSKAVNQSSPKIVPEGHHLTKALDKLSNAADRGEFLKNIIPEGPRKWLPDVFGHIQNPWVNKKAAALNPYYRKLNNAIIGSIVSSEQGRQ